MQSPCMRALLLSGLLSQAGQGQVLFLSPGQLAPADYLLNHSPPLIGPRPAKPAAPIAIMPTPNITTAAL